MQRQLDATIDLLVQHYGVEAIVQLGELGCPDLYLCVIGDNERKPITTPLPYQLASFAKLSQRLEQDLRFLRRFSQGQVLVDPEERGAQLVNLAQAKRATYQAQPPAGWLATQQQQIAQQQATIAYLFARRLRSEAHMASAKLIEQLLDVLCVGHNQLPLTATQISYELSKFDETMVGLIDTFWQQPSAARLKRLCQHVEQAVAETSSETESY